MSDRMRFVDEFRDPALAGALRSRMVELCEPGRRYQVMEVCGGHTHTIYRHGLDAYVPPAVEWVHGPGCPVCVIPKGRLDDAVWLATRDDVTLCCFGDLVRVPGSEGSLLDARARGADVRIVYSPLDALRIARAEPQREVVFFAIGFETTAPATAVTLQHVARAGVTNFSVFCNHVLVVPPLAAILDSRDVALDGMVGPGHVSTVIGLRPYEPLCRDFGVPLVVSGFEPLDLLQAVVMILEQIARGIAEVGNQYRRAVRPEGNARARALFDEVFVVRPSFEWRGLGSIPESAYGLAPSYAAFDAERRFELPGRTVADPKACRCGDVLRGTVKPWECKVFGTACTPEHPIGSCMVSSEGACAAVYNHGRHRLAGVAP